MKRWRRECLGTTYRSKGKLMTAEASSVPPFASVVSRMWYFGCIRYLIYSTLCRFCNGNGPISTKKPNPAHIATTCACMHCSAVARGLSG